MTITAGTDAHLIEQARGGSDEAVAELYRRHEPAARRLAATYPRAGAPDDLVHEAFHNVLTAINNGAGPTESFRAYLFVTLRRVAAAQIAGVQTEAIDDLPEGLQPEAPDQIIDLADRSLVLDAYGSLPERMQTVLWQTEIEGRPPRELAPVLGMTANATAALASRARERLRQAYLQAHLQQPADPGCEPHRERLGAHVRGDGTERQRQATDDHLAACAGCSALAAELGDVNRLFARAVLPWFLVPSGAAVLAGGAGGAAGAAGATGAFAALRSGASTVAETAKANPAATGAAAAGVVVAAAAVALAAMGGSDPEPVAAPSDPPTTVENTETPPPPDAPVTVAPTPPAPPAVAPEPPEPRPEPVVAPTPAPTPTTTTTTTAPPTTTTATTTTTSTTTTTTTVPPAPPPQPGPVVWVPDLEVVRTTLTNPDAQSTGMLRLVLDTLGGATVNGRPTGCAHGNGEAGDTSLVCAVPPIGPGETRVVDVPVLTDGDDQHAQVTVCSMPTPKADCESTVLGPTTIPVG